MLQQTLLILTGHFFIHIPTAHVEVCTVICKMYIHSEIDWWASIVSATPWVAGPNCSLQLLFLRTSSYFKLHSYNMHTLQELCLVKSGTLSLWAMHFISKVTRSYLSPKSWMESLPFVVSGQCMIIVPCWWWSHSKRVRLSSQLLRVVSSSLKWINDECTVAHGGVSMPD